MATARLADAIALHRAGKLPEAERIYREVLKATPGEPEARHLLGVTQYQSGRYDDAILTIREAIALKSDKAEYFSNLSLALRDAGRLDEALAAIDTAIALNPNYAEAHTNRGLVVLRMERFEDAVESHKRAIALRPELPGFHNNLGNAYRLLKEYEPAVEAYRQALRLRPQYANALFGLGVALDELHNREAARDALKLALELNDNFAEAHRRLGMILSSIGMPDEALRHLHRALELQPDDYVAVAALILAKNYLPDVTPLDLLDDARRYDAIVPPTERTPIEFANVPDRQRRLRVGFVSGDLDSFHPVGRFTEAALREVNREQFHLFAYSSMKRETQMDVFESWRDVEPTFLHQLIDEIRGDQIDVLVDLAGFTSGNRLPSFAARCAPVQVTWLGYSGTTGLQEMDYLIGDRWIIPLAEEGQYSEQIWRMPDSYLCWTPPSEAIEIGPLPAQQNGHVTFGCFNNVRKISAPTVQTWVRILEAVPNSRLLLKSAGSDPVAYDRVTGMFNAAGLDPKRWEIIELVKDKADHFRHYNRVDIALDPFPYQGTTTTVEALWMGVPVLSLVGDRFIARVGESILNTVGLPEWIAADHDDYVRKAIVFAADFTRLSALRSSLRDQLLASPLCDAPRFARNLEAAFRGMWHAWCRQQAAN